MINSYQNNSLQYFQHIVFSCKFMTPTCCCGCCFPPILTECWLVLGAGAGEAGQEETGAHGLLSNAGGGEIKRGNVTIQRTLYNHKALHRIIFFEFMYESVKSYEKGYATVASSRH